ncbi:hypothetical protein FB565_001283 [Actinoplanes lutulentus]|uniref:Uncharacterized protein DUF262 n=1 Tax=Actinoplanes lutulentus TaxID=1287878 RepID=A0A327ZGJ3_9ACTN|nr:DUF262 domain-containing protein [Actinoplanes lutulentus]MBB2941579.1 hypothetical protein [Actinoplanes lutulentus]RAK39499.1 uncharacterized protein DUF262 [Actinoplanes lutulentus]
MTRAASEPFSLTVREVLTLIEDGKFRTPSFQRPFVWTARQAVPFFESILAGLPIGAITLVEGPADGGPDRVGPIQMAVSSRADAWWIVDGSQRLGTLAGALSHLGGIGPEAIRLAYDLEADAVIPQREPARPLDLPFDLMADPESFYAWRDEREPADPYSRRATDVRSRILDYPLTLVRLLNSPVEAAAEIFLRLNDAGVGLSAVDLTHARQPHTDSLSARLAATGFGRIPEIALTEAAQGITDADRAVTRAILWLREEAGIPHISVWEKHLDLLSPLVRFFHLNRAPSARARILLIRWLWRSMGAAERRPSQPLRGADSLDAIRLLEAAPAEKPGAEYLTQVGERLALITLAPRSLLTGDPLAVASVLQAHGHAAFHRLAGSLFFGLPDEGPLPDLLAGNHDPAVLASQALDVTMISRLQAGDIDGFVTRRRRLLALSLIEAAQPFAQWGASDRPAISDLMVTDDPEEAHSHAG